VAVDVKALYEKYGPMVIRRCASILKNEDEALDAAHDVFVNLLRARARLCERYPSSLLYTMATNASLNRLRRRAREVALSDEDALAAKPDEFDTVDARILVASLFKGESEQDRAAVFMYMVDGMSLKETGAAVGLSASGVRKRLAAFKKRARRKLGLSQKE
jgi:RNA polymerase sigma-70 factor (ECF subfamily)